MPRHHPCLAPLPAPLGLRFRALLGLGFVPPRAATRVPSRVASAPGPGWQESHRMHPFFAKCAKKALFLATSARNACFSRSRWQHPRPMHPFPGAIGRFRIHGARILPPRALFRVEEPEITHGAKMLPAPPGLSAVAACGPAERALRPAAAACGPAERALRPAARAWPACRMRPPAVLLVSAAACASPPSRPRSSPPSYTRRASPPASRPPCAAIRRTAHCGRGEPSIRLFLLHSCCPRRRIAPTDARSPAPPEPQPEPTEPRPRANRVPPTHGAACVHPRPATRRASPCRAGPAAVLVIPAKWCGDTIAHTRKLRF